MKPRQELRTLSFVLLIGLLAGACAPAQVPATQAPVQDNPVPASATPTTPATETFTPSPVPPSETPTASPTPLPTETATQASVESLKASVTADQLSCRYGPGAEYLYLYGLIKGAKLELIGRTNGNNWVWVNGKNKCWVNAKFIEIEGDPTTLPVVYPGAATLPGSPYYPPTTVTKVVREGNSVTVTWLDIPLRAGDEEDESMLHYIVEVWRCESGQYIFDPLATNELSITFIDEAGCSQPSQGRVFVQEKHGFAGPAEIPWP